MAIIFAEKFKAGVIQAIQNGSETEDLVNHEMDMDFSGVKTVHIKSIKTEPLVPYDRAVDVSTGSRYGVTKEVQDEEQTFEMSQDLGFSLSVDKGNNKEQLDMKKVSAVMKAQIEEQIIPTMDTYRLKEWAENAGIHKALSTAPTNANIAKDIVDLHNEMRNKGFKGDAVLKVPYKYMSTLSLAEQWIKLENCGGKSLPSGSVGMFDGMAVKPTTDDRMPANVYFMIVTKKSCLSPVKIKDFKGHVDPPGLSGDLIEFRMIYDAYVVGKWANGVACAMAKNAVAKDCTFSMSGATASVTSPDGATIFYTTDGSDPRYSKTAEQYTTGVRLEVDQTIKAYAKSKDLYASAVTEKTYTGA